MLNDGFYPDVIVGVLRGGAVVARAFSDVLGQCNVTTVGCDAGYTDILRPNKEPLITQEVSLSIKGERTLLVDDISDSGKSLRKVSEYLAAEGPSELINGTLFVREGTVFIPDYYAAAVRKEWIIFPGEENETIRKCVRKGDKESLLACFSEEEIERVLYLDSLRSTREKEEIE